jgi:hypothetical protein
MFAKINGKWQVGFVVGQEVGHRDLRWYEWIYLRYIRIRDFITSHRRLKMPDRDDMSDPYGERNDLKMPDSLCNYCCKKEWCPRFPKDNVKECEKWEA